MGMLARWNVNTVNIRSHLAQNEDIIALFKVHLGSNSGQSSLFLKKALTSTSFVRSNSRLLSLN